MTARHRALAWVLALALVPACNRKPAPKQYPIEGQILAVAAAEKQLTIKHGDIAGLMPAMTMTFPVANAKLMEGRTPGELVTGTLEVDNSLGRLVALTHVGTAPLPEGSAAALTAPLAVGDVLPDAALIDQSNQRRAFSEWRGSTTVITFIYTRCPLPTFCPLMDQNFRTVQSEVAEDARLRGRVKLISITFDPEHDTPDVLTAHAKKLGADPTVWTFLTGDRVTIERVASRFGVGAFRSPDDPAQITHRLVTAIIGADGRLIEIYASNDWTPGTVLTDLRAAVRTP